MRHALLATAFALACAAAAAAQSGRRVKPAAPAAQPSPEQQQAGQKESAKQETMLALKRGGGGDDDAEPERDEAGNRVYFGRQVDRKARLLSRPEPAYPRRARRSAAQGTVVLRVVLAATGKVERVTVIKGLSDGLTEEAIKAARAIKFEPAEKDGRKVSQSVIMEYNFSVY